MIICYDAVKFTIKETNKNLMKALNLPDKYESSLLKYLINLYQDNCSSIFKFDDEKFKKIKDSYKKNCKKTFTQKYDSPFENIRNLDEESGESTESQNNNDIILPATSNNSNPEISSSDKKDKSANMKEFKIEIKEEYENYLEELLESSDFKKFVANLFSLCVYMQLSDPQLKMPIDNFKNRKYDYRSFKKNEYICIDGFAKEGSPCLTIIPPVMRNNYSYNGIKPSVLVLPENFATDSILNKINQVERDEELKKAKKLEKEKEEEATKEKEDNETEANESSKYICQFQPISTIANFSVDLKMTNTSAILSFPTTAHNISLDALPLVSSQNFSGFIPQQQLYESNSDLHKEKTIPRFSISMNNANEYINTNFPDGTKELHDRIEASPISNIDDRNNITKAKLVPKRKALKLYVIY